jgi:hypothetical protein
MEYPKPPSVKACSVRKHGLLENAIAERTPFKLMSAVFFLLAGLKPVSGSSKA